MVGSFNIFRLNSISKKGRGTSVISPIACLKVIGVVVVASGKQNLFRMSVLIPTKNTRNLSCGIL